MTQHGGIGKTLSRPEGGYEGPSAIEPPRTHSLRHHVRDVLSLEVVRFVVVVDVACFLVIVSKQKV